MRLISVYTKLLFLVHFLFSCSPERNQSNQFGNFLSKFPDLEVPLSIRGDSLPINQSESRLDSASMRNFLCSYNFDCSIEGESWQMFSCVSFGQLKASSKFHALIYEHNTDNGTIFILNTYTLEGKIISSLFFAGIFGDAEYADGWVDEKYNIKIRSGVPLLNAPGGIKLKGEVVRNYTILENGKIQELK